MNKSSVIVALDTPDLAQAQILIEELSGTIDYFKVGFELFTAHGWKAVELVKKSGAKVFLDLKLHDIPNTVAKTASVICEHEVDMFNVHALGGLAMMQKAREVLETQSKGKERPKLIAVTVLTSHGDEELKRDLGIHSSAPDQVRRLAKLTHEAGLDGVVSSPQEISLVREVMGKDALIVTPGIRLSKAAGDDQKRTLRPQEAIEAGATHLVIGRPITQAPNPLEAAKALFKNTA